MENQHRKISGYRELSQDEIDLMNRIKAKQVEMLELVGEVSALLESQDKAQEARDTAAFNSRGMAYRYPPTVDATVMARHEIAEPRRWLAMAKTDLQVGCMKLIRAVAQPTDC